MEARNLTVMFTDMRGFTAETSRRSRKDIESLLESHERVTKNVITSHHGKLIKNLGDGYLVIFESPTNALLAAAELQSQIAKGNEDLPSKDRYLLKIALASGDVIVKNDDVFGEPVNTAARVLATVNPGEIYLTQSVYLAMNKNELIVSELGAKSFKGIPHKVRLYKVVSRKNKLGQLLAPFQKAFAGKRMAGNLRYAVFVVAFLLVGAGVFAAFKARQQAIEFETVEGVSTEVTTDQYTQSSADESTTSPTQNSNNSSQKQNAGGNKATPPGQVQGTKTNQGGGGGTTSKGGGACNKNKVCDGNENSNNCPEDCSTPTPTPSPSPTTHPQQPVGPGGGGSGGSPSNCSEYCGSLNYSQGTCSKQNECGGTVEPGGNGFCSTPPNNKCCCI